MAHSGSTGQRSLRGRSRLSSKDLSPPRSRQGVRGAYRGSGRLPEVSACHRRRPSASACLWDLRASASPGLARSAALCAPGVDPQPVSGAPAVAPQLSPRESSLGALPRARVCDAAEARGRVSRWGAPSIRAPASIPIKIK
ncbi:hypothetical protein NDU88_003998 [Pleurodeles waltl]|uniref:Uncharacterized protein n=1 Tax=Pleurodeles waltl TaxID=8319 RepID=A0AAV7T8B4_PLEWA|nr:hypothetical protein NDU88_003998 [Pleurodeles waltl]